MTDTRTCTLCSWPTDREHSGTYILTLVQTSGGVNSQRRELTICDHCLEHRDTIATIGRGREGSPPGCATPSRSTGADKETT